MQLEDERLAEAWRNYALNAQHRRRRCQPRQACPNVGRPKKNDDAGRFRGGVIGAGCSRPSTSLIPPEPTVSGGVRHESGTQADDRYGYDKQKRRALERWERKLKTIIGQPALV